MILEIIKYPDPRLLQKSEPVKEVTPEVEKLIEGAHREEGCFSLQEKKMDYPVWRAESVKLRWMNRKGQIRMQTFTGYQAQIIQHEYAHIEGKLCCGSQENLLKGAA